MLKRGRTKAMYEAGGVFILLDGLRQLVGRGGRDRVPCCHDESWQSSWVTLVHKTLFCFYC